MALIDLVNFFRDSYQNQVILCSTLMLIVPFTTFFYLRSYLSDLWIATDNTLNMASLQTEVDTYSAFGAVAGT